MLERLRLRAAGLRCGGAIGTLGREWIRIWCCAVRCGASRFRAVRRWSGTLCGCSMGRLRRCIHGFPARYLRTCHLAKTEGEKDDGLRGTGAGRAAGAAEPDEGVTGERAAGSAHAPGIACGPA